MAPSSQHLGPPGNPARFTYALTCAAGHKTLGVLPNPRWTLLFESAVVALVDGYHREAIASFAGALEDFYAFYVRVVARARGLDESTVKALAKEVRLAEPRRGAFHVMHTLETGEVFKLESSKRKEFRNEVVHGGRWPTREEAVGYGDFVFQVFSTSGGHLWAKHRDAWFSAHAEELADILKAHEPAAERGGATPFAAVMVTLVEHHLKGDVPASLTGLLTVYEELLDSVSRR